MSKKIAMPTGSFTKSCLIWSRWSTSTKISKISSPNTSSNSFLREVRSKKMIISPSMIGSGLSSSWRTNSIRSNHNWMVMENQSWSNVLLNKMYAMRPTPSPLKKLLTSYGHILWINIPQIVLTNSHLQKKKLLQCRLEELWLFVWNMLTPKSLRIATILDMPKLLQKYTSKNEHQDSSTKRLPKINKDTTI